MHHTTHILTTGILFLLIALTLRVVFTQKTGNPSTGWRGLARQQLRRAGGVLCSFFLYSGLFLLLLAVL
ncbi:hypothetical protein [Dinghuibacter silviterrae]|uniref:Uncharacterized protein n=1 Tax=Dinghuibacter silviterrae TaxID=1539049 RepID=A0A4R8DQS8_9BACT|nr:hypothetical protein [Dinghuibacter silviterrae]TDX00299.1 hypothetical protein EDB95_1320 [Dinghuibacter silviterrae]